MRGLAQQSHHGTVGIPGLPPATARGQGWPPARAPSFLCCRIRLALPVEDRALRASRRFRRWATGVLAVWIALAPSLAFGDWELLGGWEADSHNTGYIFGAVGYIHSFTPRVALATRAATSYLYYSFPANGGETKVQSPGFTLLAGPRVSGERITLTVMAGAEGRTIRRETTTPTGRFLESDDELGPVVNGTFWGQISPRVDFLGIVNYDSVNSYTWARVGAKYRVTDSNRPISVSLGPEGTVQTNPDIFSVQGGGVFEVFHRPSRLSVAFRLGYKRSTFDEGPSRDGPYWGIGFYTQF